MVGTELCLWQPYSTLQFCQPLLHIRGYKHMEKPAISYLEILPLPLVAGEEVLTSLQGRNGSEGEHLPECDTKRPDITLVAVLPVGQTLYGLPPHRDVGVGVHLIEVIGGHSRQSKVRYFHGFLISDLAKNNESKLICIYVYIEKTMNQWKDFDFIIDQ